MNKFLGMCALLLAMVVPAFADADTAVLDWTANTETDLAGYKVYQSTVSGSYGTPTATLGKVITTTLTLPTLTVDQRYFFAITAYDIAGNESPKSNEVSKIALVAPGTPVLTLTALSANSIRVSWPNVIAVDGSVALIDIRFAASPITWATAMSISCSASPCTVTGLAASTSYQFQGQTWRVNSVGGKVFGAISTAVAVTTLPIDLPPTAPVGVTVK
jgi:hypothetical protein